MSTLASGQVLVASPLGFIRFAVVILVIGLIVGGVARLVLPGPHPIGLWRTVLVGVVGAILGGFIADSIGGNLLIAAILATVAAAVLVALLSRSKTSRITR